MVRQQGFQEEPTEAASPDVVEYSIAEIPAIADVEHYLDNNFTPEEVEKDAAKVQAEVAAAYAEAERALELMREEGDDDELTAGLSG